MSTPVLSPSKRMACLSIAIALSVGAVHAQNPSSPCAFKREALDKAFGLTFDDGKPEQGIGPACTYLGKGKGELKLWVGFMPASGPFESMRFMLGPAKTQFVPVAGDPDKAMTVAHAPDVPPFPHIVYVRGGQLVQVHLTGLAASDPATRQKQIAEANAKLLALPRLP